MKTLELLNKRILITGVNGFLGQKIYDSLVDEGAQVVGIDLSQSSRGDKLDISNSKDVKSFIDNMGLMFDGLVNNAAFSLKSKNISDEDFDKTIKINTFGTYNMIVNLRSFMKDGASIVNLSSIYASRSPDFSIYDGNEELYSNVSYGISKAGIEQMTRYYSRLFGPEIRVNAIEPGGIYQGHSNDFVTKYSRMVPLKRMAYVEEIVNSILFLLSPLSSYISGHVLKVDGGMNA